MPRRARGWGQRKGRLTLRRWGWSVRCKCSRIDRGVSRNLPRSICLGPQTDEFIPCCVAEASVLLKRGKCTNEATPLGLLSTSGGGALEGKCCQMRNLSICRTRFSNLYLLQVRRCDSCFASGPLKVQPGALGHGATRIGHSARWTSRSDGGSIFLHALETTSFILGHYKSWDERCTPHVDKARIGMNTSEGKEKML